MKVDNIFQNEEQNNNTLYIIPDISGMLQPIINKYLGNL